MALKTELEVELMSNPEKIWEAIKNSTNWFPKIFPELYKSMETIEGDGYSVGSVRLVTYAEGVPLTSAKEKTEMIDEENKMVAYCVVGGDVENVFTNFKKTFTVSPKGEGSLAKFIIEYDQNEGEEVWEPKLIEESALQIFKDLDAYLMKN